MNRKCYNCGNTVLDEHLYCPQCGYNQAQSNIIYHYTTLETAIKILFNIDNNNKIILRANKFDSMNDPNDCVYFINELRRLFPSKIIDRKEMYKEGVPYVTSFSPLSDDLHMWTCYGDNGKGVAIGFDRNSLMNIEYKNKNKTPDIVKLYSCHYLRDKEIVNFLESYKISEANLDKLSDRDLWHISYIIKHPCYRYEMEERLLVASMDASNRLLHNESNCDEIPLDNYLELQIPINSIKEIILGPMLISILEKHKDLMQQYGSLLKFSSIPYCSK